MPLNAGSQSRSPPSMCGRTQTYRNNAPLALRTLHAMVMVHGATHPREKPANPPAGVSAAVAGRAEFHCKGRCLSSDVAQRVVARCSWAEVSTRRIAAAEAVLLYRCGSTREHSQERKGVSEVHHVRHTILVQHRNTIPLSCGMRPEIPRRA